VKTFFTFLLLCLQILWAKEIIGEVKSIRGDKRATLFRDGRIISLKPHTKIYQNDRVKALRNSFVWIKMQDDAWILIGQKSSFDFRNYPLKRQKKLKNSIQNQKSMMKFVCRRFKIEGDKTIAPISQNFMRPTLNCQVTLPTIGKLIRKRNGKNIYKVDKNQNDILHFFTLGLPNNVLLTKLSILPNRSGFVIFASELRSTKFIKEYEIKYIKKDATVELSCKNIED
jgi:hypothetical protein